MELPKVIVDIDTTRENISFSLYRTINVINDITGKGKTNMVSKMLRLLNNFGPLKMKGYYEGNLVEYTIVPISTLSQLVDTKDDFRCYIFDDLKSSFYNEAVSRLYKNAKKAVFLFISRGSADGYKIGYTSFAEAIYSLNYSKNENKEYFSLKKYLDSVSKHFDTNKDIGSIETRSYISGNFIF